MSKDRYSGDSLRPVSDSLEDASPREVLTWGFDTFGDGIALATGFGPSGIVLMHLVSQIRPETTIFYLDTQLLFEETYALRDELEERLGVRIQAVTPKLTVEEQARKHGPELWQRAPDHCCYLRKVQPLKDFLSRREAWITGIRRDQSRSRNQIAIVDWDAANEVVKLCPLANWTAEDVWSYLRMNDLPYNPLHDRGYPSIGCVHCTRPVSKGDDERAGRWSGHEKTECGIHLQPPVAA